MRILKLSVLLLVMLSNINFAAAQVVQGPFPWVKIGGLPMHCTTARGQSVDIYIDQRVNQYIGTASNNGHPIIRLGPGFFNQVPPFVGQFWFSHECAHHVVGSSEVASDCLAIKMMRDNGLISNDYRLEMLINQISQMPGTSRHLPGPMRAEKIRQCFFDIWN